MTRGEEGADVGLVPMSALHSILTAPASHAPAEGLERAHSIMIAALMEAETEKGVLPCQDDDMSKPSPPCEGREWEEANTSSHHMMAAAAAAASGLSVLKAKPQLE